VITSCAALSGSGLRATMLLFVSSTGLVPLAACCSGAGIDRTAAAASDRGTLAGPLMCSNECCKHGH